MTFPLFLLLLALVTITLVMWRKLLQARRADYIRSYTLPAGLYDRLRKRRPELTIKDCQLVSHALRQFFLAYLKSGHKFVSMPSQVADDLWHEFILYTKNYEHFCRHAFGGFLHHTPAVVLGTAQQNNAGLRRCWWFTCREENINPREPTRLPLLFALDAKLKVADGFHYVADCSAVRRTGASSNTSGAVYCGGDFSSSSFDGGTDGFGDSGSFDISLGDGDGGSGCGGGGCGGGD
jgi:hypothetical protein